MSNDPHTDLHTSQLISKSLYGHLEESERRQLEESLANDEAARAFNGISKLIQESVVEIASRSLAGDASPGLSAASKDRMRQSIRAAKQESVRLRNTLGESDVTAPTDIEETRQATSQFQLLRPIGEGGLGSVWLAVDEKIKRKVAIKFLSKEGVQSPKAWQRFHREAEVTGLLEHPNVVPLYQYGNDPRTGEPFYAMRFVGKRTLSDAILEYHALRKMGEVEDLGMHRLLNVFLDICQAIAYAHSRGVVHRDLKPENVALDSFGQVVVLDWGLAKLMDDGELSDHVEDKHDAFDSVLTRTLAGEVVGTPLYMAPEQAAGNHDNVDRRTDVYGLGAILFSILTGSAPHEKTHASGCGKLKIKEFLEQVATQPPPNPRDYCASIPRELERICLKAMAMQPFARYASAEDLAQAVERWMAGQNEKTTRYENLRMEGRELRSNFERIANMLETNARFVTTLPPIQEIIHANQEEDHAAWCKRLATIATGLLGSINDFTSVVLSQIEGDQFKELVRVERHKKDLAKVRPIPRSRLRTGVANEFIRKVMDGNPDETLLSLISDPLCDHECDRPHLVGGIPIYDETTEEPFGVILITCNLDAVFSKQLAGATGASEIMAACDTHHVMMQQVDGKVHHGTCKTPVVEVAPHFAEAVNALQTQDEYIDETDHEVYGARLWLIPQQHGLMYLLRMAGS